ncbi:hypothetical protein OUZ56_029929 [Daphnia magna]|uniref:Uncharacterized protein n=1 Tax=Daphnia magna TaxID=35525 RepID=A0ABR0B881_9CRUS|nr:hypothetical protein OUZ56_029929 [Daphnia magna]
MVISTSPLTIPSTSKTLSPALTPTPSRECGRTPSAPSSREARRGIISSLSHHEEVEEHFKNVALY